MVMRWFSTVFKHFVKRNKTLPKPTTAIFFIGNSCKSPDGIWACIQAVLKFEQLYWGDFCNAQNCIMSF